MIKAEQIPDEVVEELHAIFADDFGTLIPKGSCRAVIAAAINAWPDAFITKYSEGAPAFNLPLQHEDNDD